MYRFAKIARHFLSKIEQSVIRTDGIHGVGYLLFNVLDNDRGSKFRQMAADVPPFNLLLDIQGPSSAAVPEDKSVLQVVDLAEFLRVRPRDRLRVDTIGLLSAPRTC